MPTIVSKTIGTGGDYSDHATWIAACPANLVTADQVWKGLTKNQAFSYSSGFTISGITVDATRYVWLTTDAGASFRDNANVQTNALRFNSANGAAISLTGNYQTLITDSVDYTLIENLQLEETAAASIIYNNPGATSHNLQQFCIVELKATRGYKLTGGTARNCLFVWRASPTDGIECSFGGAIYNCTLTGTFGFGPTNMLRGNYGAVTAENCAFLSAPTITAGSNTFTFITCYSEAASPPSGITGGLANSTATFASVTDGSHDYRLVSGSALVDAGTTDSTNAAVDIAGTARPSGSAYDVGCWEFVQSVSGTLKTAIGLVTASIKTVIGLAKASVKTFNGLTP